MTASTGTRASGRRWLVFAALALALVAVRGPLHAVTFGLPVSNDDAIPLLMARHILRGELATVLWNQPYNGVLDAYLLAPGLIAASPHTVFRAYEAVCGLLLVAAVGMLAGAVAGRGAAILGALLAAVGSPYMALMAATGPTPNFLVPLLVAVPVGIGLRALNGDEGAAAGVPLGVAAACGVIGGLAVWDSVLAVPALAGAGVGFLAAGFRPRPAAAALFTAGLIVGASPLQVARVVGASASSTVTAIRPRWLWMAGLTDLVHATSGLFGLDVPLVVDGPERAALPTAIAGLLGIGLVMTLAAAVTNKKRALPLVGWAAGLAAAFVLSRRTGGDEVRYLFGLTVPVLALVGCGLARVQAWPRLGAWQRPLAALLAAAIAVPWLVGQRVLVSTWRDPRHAAQVWQVPPLGPAVQTLERAGVRSAYASLQFAGRIALESGESVMASQAWNERIPGDPLRFRDEVDLDPAPAWVLSPHLSRGMPRAAGFRALLQGMGGGWKEDVAGDLVVFRRFVPPYNETRPVPAGEFDAQTLDGTSLPPAARSGDPARPWTSPSGISRGSGLAVRLDRPRRLSALVVGLDPERSPLAVPWVCEVDGVVVTRGPAAHGLQWVNGAPRAARQAALAIPLGDRVAGEVRLIFQDAGPPLQVWGLFLYGPDEEALPTAGASGAAAAFEAARAGDWDGAARLYAEAARLEPHRVAYRASLARALWRAAHRRRVDVESLGDGGAPLVTTR
jgi:hypothetical protein